MKNILGDLLNSMRFHDGNASSVSVIANTSRQFPYKIEVVAENLYVPWAIDISNEGNLYFTERSGKVRIIEGRNLHLLPLITFPEPSVTFGEGGLMGIALDPGFSQNHYMYIMHSYIEDNRIFNRVIRLVGSANKASIDRVILDKIPGGRIHNGGRLKVGPDQKLYITTGDAGNSALPQDITSLAGKILRIELDGRIPEDNPFTNSPIYSLGHRNPQGLAWNSQNILYSSEHGQLAHDEINIIHPGANYGWPLVQGNEKSDKVVVQKPLIHSGSDTWAPSGITFVNQGPWQGNLLVATLRGQRLLITSLNADGTVVKNIEAWSMNEYGRLREVIQSKDGTIYLTTSNMDGRGDFHKGDDKILRLLPK